MYMQLGTTHTFNHLLSHIHTHTHTHIHVHTHTHTHTHAHTHIFPIAGILTFITHRMDNSSQHQLIGHSLKKQLYISLQQSRLCEELGHPCIRLCRFFVSVTLEHRTLRRRGRRGGEKRGARWGGGGEKKWEREERGGGGGGRGGREGRESRRVKITRHERESKHS